LSRRPVGYRLLSRQSLGQPLSTESHGHTMAELIQVNLQPYLADREEQRRPCLGERERGLNSGDRVWAASVTACADGVGPVPAVRLKTCASRASRDVCVSCVSRRVSLSSPTRKTASVTGCFRDGPCGWSRSVLVQRASRDVCVSYVPYAHVSASPTAAAVPAPPP
jgi:hypothetical protein